MPPHGSRRFHEAGVGSRTGLRLSAVARDQDGFEDLDAFYKASQAAMDDQGGDDDQDIDDEDDYSYTRVSTSGINGKRRGPSSSSMDVQNSSAPSPRSALRKPGQPSTSSPGTGPPSSSRYAPSPRSGPNGRANITLADDYDDGNEDLPNLSTGSRSFDLTAMAGDDAAAMEDEDEYMVPQAHRTPTAPSKGLSARSKGKEREAAVARRIDLEDSDEDTYHLPASGLDDYATAADDYGSGDLEAYTATTPSPARKKGRPKKPETTTRSQPSPAGAAAVKSSTATQPHLEPPSPLPSPSPEPEPPLPSQEPPKRKRGRPPKNRSVEQDDGVHRSEALAVNSRAKKSKTTGKRSAEAEPSMKSGTDRAVMVEKVRSQTQSSRIDENGVRRSTRQRFAPLEYWRGEHIRYGRPSLPKGVTPADLRRRTTAGEDEFEDDPAMMLPMRRVPVLDVKEVIRIPRAPGEGTFSGTYRKRTATRSGSQGRRGGSRQPDEPTPTPDREFEDPYRLDAKGDTIQPEDGWDEQTTSTGLVINAETGQEEEREVVRIKASLHPMTVPNNKFMFQKVFNCEGLMATGILQLPPGTTKPTKPSKDNNFVFTVLQGALRVQIHRKVFTIGPGGIFNVPAGNTYSLKNICERTVHVFFAQCRRFKKADAADITTFSQVSDTSYATPTMSRPVLQDMRRSVITPNASQLPKHDNRTAIRAEVGEQAEEDEEDEEDEEEDEDGDESEGAQEELARGKAASQKLGQANTQIQSAAYLSEDEEDDFEASRTLKQAKRKFRKFG